MFFSNIISMQSSQKCVDINILDMDKEKLNLTFHGYNDIKEINVYQRKEKNMLNLFDEHSIYLKKEEKTHYYIMILFQVR